MPIRLVFASFIVHITMCRTSIGVILGILYDTFHEVSTYGLYMYNKYNKREHTCMH